MTRREKTIVGLALAALIYGGTMVALPKLRSSSHQDSMKRQVEAVRQTAERTRLELQTNAFTRAERSVLDGAVSGWAANPFPEGPVAGGGKSKATAIVYAGYLNMNGQRLAVINGVEYRVKDTLKQANFTVESIEPDKVVLSQRIGGARLVVPIEKNESK